MADPRSSTRHRLIQAAIQLFIAQGVTETTTRQIADLAGVNEVTLFRQFGNKYGLLLAVMEDMEALRQIGMALGQQPEDSQTENMEGAAQSLKSYASVHLQALEQIQEFVRSLIGEAAHYPVENRRALGRSLSQANRYTAQYLAAVMHHEHLQTRMSTNKLASLLNSLLLGYAVLEFTSEINELWQNRESFIDGLVELFLYGAIARPQGHVPASVAAGSLTGSASPALPIVVNDLPAGVVHHILKQAKKLGTQEYAIAYILFAAGLTADEIVALRRSDVHIEAHQMVLSRVRGDRQVPVNQWILGRRLGSPKNNPLTRWLNVSREPSPTVFVNAAGQALTVAEVEQIWQAITAEINAPDAPPQLVQAHQTWCVDMLIRGMSVDDLSVLVGCSVNDLQPYARRAREKAILDRAARLDQKLGNPGSTNVVSSTEAV